MQRPRVLKLGQKEANIWGRAMCAQKVKEEMVEAGNASKFI